MAEIKGIGRVPPVEKVLGIPKDRQHRPDTPEKKPTPERKDNLGDQTPVEPHLGNIIDEIV